MKALSWQPHRCGLASHKAARENSCGQQQGQTTPPFWPKSSLFHCLMSMEKFSWTHHFKYIHVIIIVAHPGKRNQSWRCKRFSADLFAMKGSNWSWTCTDISCMLMASILIKRSAGWRCAWAQNQTFGMQIKSNSGKSLHSPAYSSWSWQNNGGEMSAWNKTLFIECCRESHQVQAASTQWTFVNRMGVIRQDHEWSFLTVKYTKKWNTSYDYQFINQTNIDE